MKFGKLLKSWTIEEMHGNDDLMLRFKELKKQLKLIKPEVHYETAADQGEVKEDSKAKDGSFESVQQAEATTAERLTETQQALAPEERIFLQTLKEDLDKFNDFFIDKEEDFIIQTRSLQDSMKETTDSKRLKSIRKEFTDLHGSMILLLHWSLLNFTAVIKILKKHDKHSAILLRQPLSASILKQPFNSTERITKLIKEVEKESLALLNLEESGLADPSTATSTSDVSALQDVKAQQADLSRKTRAALDVWEEMRSNASTPSTVLPLLEKQKQEATGAQHREDLKRRLPESEAADGERKKQNVSPADF